jgi:hypothetical protein
MKFSKGFSRLAVGAVLFFSINLCTSKTHAYCTQQLAPESVLSTEEFESIVGSVLCEYKSEPVSLENIASMYADSGIKRALFVETVNEAGKRTVEYACEYVSDGELVLNYESYCESGNESSDESSDATEKSDVKIGKSKSKSKSEKEETKQELRDSMDEEYERSRRETWKRMNRRRKVIPLHELFDYYRLPGLGYLGIASVPLNQTFSALMEKPLSTLDDMQYCLNMLSDKLKSNYQFRMSMRVYKKIGNFKTTTSKSLWPNKWLRKTYAIDHLLRHVQPLLEKAICEKNLEEERVRQKCREQINKEIRLRDEEKRQVLREKISHQVERLSGEVEDFYVDAIFSPDSFGELAPEAEAYASGVYDSTKNYLSVATKLNSVDRQIEADQCVGFASRLLAAGKKTVDILKYLGTRFGQGFVQGGTDVTGAFDRLLVLADPDQDNTVADFNEFCTSIGDFVKRIGNHPVAAVGDALSFCSRAFVNVVFYATLALSLSTITAGTAAMSATAMSVHGRLCLAKNIFSPDGIMTAGSAAAALQSVPVMTKLADGATSVVGAVATHISTVAEAGRQLAEVCCCSMMNGGGCGSSRDEKFQSRGSTADLSKGTTLPRNLKEQLAAEEVKADPLKGKVLEDIKMTDPRWPASEGWVKRQYIHGEGEHAINVHYVHNKITGMADDFKIKLS